MEILGLDGQVEERIKEVDFGLFEGNTYEEIRTSFQRKLKYGMRIILIMLLLKEKA